MKFRYYTSLNIREWQSSIKWHETKPSLSITHQGILMILEVERILMSLVPMEEIVLPEVDVWGEEVP